MPGGAIDVAAKDDKFVVAIGSGAAKDALSPAALAGRPDPYRTAAGLLGDTKPSLFLDTPQVVTLLSSFAGNDAEWAKAKPTLDTFGPAAAGLTKTDDAVHLKAASPSRSPRAGAPPPGGACSAAPRARAAGGRAR